jgi:tripartite-type tricarboxylate transporter receptor subunit TctC
MSGRRAPEPHTLSASLSAAALAAAFLFAAPAIAVAQEYPTRPVHLVVPNPAGGGMDALARVYGKALEARLGQPVVVENRPGQGTSLGGAAVARALPDGYTLLQASASTLAINVSLYKKLGYDPLTDFTPIALFAAVPFVLVVHPSLQVTSFRDFVALAKAKPGGLSYASAGVGSVHHIFMELVKVKAGLDIHHVPYRGGGPALTDVVGGHLPMMFADAGQALPFVKEGRLLALAVSTGKRVETLPDVPTLHEAGLAGVDMSDWQALVAPADLPESIRTKLHAALADAMAAPETRAFMAGRGLQTLSSTPAELAAYIRSEITRWAEVVKAAGASAE